MEDTFSMTTIKVLNVCDIILIFSFYYYFDDNLFTYHRFKLTLEWYTVGDNIRESFEPNKLGVIWEWLYLW